MMTRQVVQSPSAGLACRRESGRFPGLVLELNAPFLTFRHPPCRAPARVRGPRPERCKGTCEVYQLVGGTAELIASSRESYRDLARFEHARRVAAVYARVLARRG